MEGRGLSRTNPRAAAPDPLGKAPRLSRQMPLACPVSIPRTGANLVVSTERTMVRFPLLFPWQHRRWIVTDAAKVLRPG